MKIHSLLRILGIALVLAGLVMIPLAINGLSVPRAMGGPMGVSLHPLEEILALGTGMIFLHGGCYLSKITWNRMYLLVAVISVGFAFKNLWFYPFNDGAYYLLRYGRNGLDRFLLPTPWQHFFAWVCSASFLYIGLITTFSSIFSSRPAALWRQSLYWVALCLMAAVLIYLLGMFYEVFFVKSLMSGAISASQRQMRALGGFFLPIGLVAICYPLRMYPEVALLIFVSAAVMLLLLGLTYGAEYLVLS